MSALLRGLNEGLQTGLRLGGTLRDVRQRQALADEAARFNVTEGAYGPELEQNIEQVRGLMTEAQRQAAAQGGTVEDMARIEAEYMPSIQELQRRSQMTAPDFSIASGPQAFGTREAATRAARPMRAEGLANVYRQFGDIDEAERQLERADAARLRDVQFQQAELGLRGAQRTEREAEGMQMAQQLLAGAEQAGQPITSEFIRVVASQTGANYNAVVDSAAKAIGFTEASATAALNQLKRDLAKASTTGVDGLNKFLAERFDPDETDTFKPEVTRDARGNFVVTYNGEVLPEYGASRSLEELVARARGNIDGDPLGTVKALLDIDLRRAQINASVATAGLTNQRIQSLINSGANAEEREEILAEYDALSPEEQAGAKGQALVRRFNMLNVRAGGTVPMGGTARATSALSKAQDDLLKDIRQTEGWKRALERGDQPALRKILTDNNIPPEAVLGVTAAPPGGGSMTPAQPAAQPARPAAQPARPAAETPAAPAQQGPSPAALRALRERPITRFTDGDVVEAAAAAGNPAAIRELNARRVAAERTTQRTQEQMRGLQ